MGDDTGTMVARPTPTMPAKLSNLWLEYYETSCKLADLHKSIKRTEQQLAHLSKEWQETIAKANQELKSAANPTEALEEYNAPSPKKAEIEALERAIREAKERA